MIRRSTKKLLLLSLLLGLLGVGYCATTYEKGPIVSYRPGRDRAFILELFDNNWYWLLTHRRGEYDPGFMLDHQSRTMRPEDFGKLTTKVFVEDGKPIGFVTYYMETFIKGRLLFIVVAQKYRSKHYGDRLLRFACRQLFKKGAKNIHLLTRTDNKPAIKLYKRIGFKVLEQDESLVSFYLRPENFNQEMV